ncbi:ABC-2 type transporter [compost metagenome]
MVGMICFNAIGFIIASRASHEGTMNMLSTVFSMPMIFISTAFYSLDGAPTWVRYISKANPVEYASIIGRSAVMGEVAGQSFLVLMLLAVVFSILAVKTFRYE